MKALAFGLIALCAGAGCARTPAAEAPAAAATTPVAAAPDDSDCTLQTPLVPGVPGSPGNLIPSEVNPNGASELASLMRAMQRDLEEARATILRGEAPPPLAERHRRIRCSWPTAETDRNPTFDAMAITYVAAVRALDAKPEDLLRAHDGVLTACRACHETSCPGPIEAIEALRISRSAAE